MSLKYGATCFRESRTSIVNEASKSAMKASITGPMLPSSVESNVEQYLKINLSVPTAFNQLSACRDWLTASRTGIVRVFKAITTASTEGSTSF